MTLTQTLEGVVLLDRYNLPDSARSVVFYERNNARVESVRAPLDIHQHSLGIDGRFGVLIQPMIVGLCPSDQAGGSLEFPPRSVRSFSDDFSPAVAGHEFVGRVVRADKNSLEALRERYIDLGSTVVGDINLGCSDCFQCERKDPAIYCANGTTFAGIGSSPNALWVREQTGRSHLPGAYTEGFMVLPVSNVYRVPGNPKNDELAVYSQADAVACAKTSCDAMGITTFNDLRKFDNPEILVAGAGRLGTWHIAVASSLLPNSKFFIADTNEDNLRSVGEFFGIPTSNRYHIRETSDSYSKENLSRGFNRDVHFDFVIDTAGHGVFDGATIMDVVRNSMAKGGAFCTTAHIGSLGVESLHPELVMGMKRIVNGLSPQGNFEFAIRYLTSKLGRFSTQMREIKGGLTDELAQIVQDGGGRYKRQMEGTTFYTSIR